jgi:hypothetical protein
MRLVGFFKGKKLTSHLGQFSLVKIQLKRPGDGSIRKLLRDHFYTHESVS